MDKRLQTDVWNLASKLSKGLIALDSPAVTQTKQNILERFPEIEETKEWGRILSVIRTFPGIEANSLCEKAGVSLTALIHMEEVDNNQLLLRVTRRGVARFYNLGDWGIFWLVLTDKEANQEKSGKIVSEDTDKENTYVNGDERLIVDVEKRTTNVKDDFHLWNLTRPLNDNTRKSQLINLLKEGYIVDEVNGLNKEIESTELKDKEDYILKKDSKYTIPRIPVLDIEETIFLIISFFLSGLKHYNKHRYSVRHTTYNLNKDRNIKNPTQ